MNIFLTFTVHAVTFNSILTKTGCASVLSNNATTIKFSMMTLTTRFFKEDGSIEQISNKHFSNLINGQFVCVWFFAQWCGPCKAVKPVIERIADEFNDRIKFYKETGILLISLGCI